MAGLCLVVELAWGGSYTINVLITEAMSLPAPAGVPPFLNNLGPWGDQGAMRESKLGIDIQVEAKRTNSTKDRATLKEELYRELYSVIALPNIPNREYLSSWGVPDDSLRFLLTKKEMEDDTCQWKNDLMVSGPLSAENKGKRTDVS